MTLAEIQKIAKKRGISLPAKVTKQDAVRTIQQAEGNNPCFNTKYRESCGQDKCLWRKDCSAK